MSDSTAEFVIEKNNNKTAWLQNSISVVRKRILENSNGSDKVVIDLSNVGFLEPIHVVSLACLFEEMQHAGKRLTIRFDPGESGWDYLDKINFFSFWQEGFDRRSFTPSRIKTSIGVWQISHEMTDASGIAAQKYFQNSDLSDSCLDPLKICLAELFNNIFDHSCSEIKGFVCTQFYPSLKQIKFAVCDFGIGI